MQSPLDWETEGSDWPNRDASRFVTAAGLRWHVQVAGSGPALLLLHGTGAATHSWRGLLPLLAQRFTVVAPDLPGHGFTAGRPVSGLSSAGMSEALAGLLKHIDIEPQLVIGHSAGAAIAVRMSLDQHLGRAAIISLNGALLPPEGMSALIFSPAAKLLAASGLASRLFSWGAGDRSAVERLIRSTGSTLDAAGIDFYARLVRNPAHVAGVLDMMSSWDLHALGRDLARLSSPLLLVVGENDKTVLPEDARRAQQRLPQARLLTLPGLGHLAHEERPDLVAAIIIDTAMQTARQHAG